MQTYTHIFIFSDNETAFYDKSRENRWWMSGGVNLHVHGILVFIFKYKNLSNRYYTWIWWGPVNTFVLSFFVTLTPPPNIKYKSSNRFHWNLYHLKTTVKSCESVLLSCHTKTTTYTCLFLFQQGHLSCLLQTTTIGLTAVALFLLGRFMWEPAQGHCMLRSGDRRGQIGSWWTRTQLQSPVC